MPIATAPREPSLPFTRYRAISVDGTIQLRIAHWHDKNRTLAFYASEQLAQPGRLDGQVLTLSTLDDPAGAAPCLAPAVDPAGPGPFTADSAFGRSRVQLPERRVHVLFVPSPTFLKEIDEDLASPMSRLEALWDALVRLNAAAALLHRELQVELVPVLTRNVAPSGPGWDEAGLGKNFALIAAAAQGFCRTCAFDIAHALTGRTEGGAARIAEACTAEHRASGYSPQGQTLATAHEIAHQLGASHTFSQGTNWHAAGAVEPGVGATVMVHSASRYYFHTWSSAQIRDYLSSSRCTSFGGREPGSGNNAPEFAGPSATVTVPPRTAVRFDLQASDADGDRLRLRCEGIDRGAKPGAVPPVFGSSIDVVDGAVVVPGLAGIFVDDLPASQAGTSLQVVCTARDHKGGMALAQIAVTVVGAGPFSAGVAPGGAGQPITVTWNDPGTAAAEVSVGLVRLQLVDARGTVVPWVASASGGTHRARLPGTLARGTWRVWVQPIGQPFFALSDSFTVP
jgi:hypothetical protein